jgi:hypothetical protein
MSDTEPKVADMLALDRTRMAAERTLMAWLRTALSMISFGFTIDTFLNMLQEQSPVSVLRPQAPRNVGLTLIGIGTGSVATLEIHKEVEPGSILQALGPNVHRGLPDWGSWRPDVREHQSQNRPLRLIGGVTNLKALHGSSDGKEREPCFSWIRFREY